MNTHSSLYSLSVYTLRLSYCWDRLQTRWKDTPFPDFKSAFDIPSWTFCALIIDCVILLFKNEWMPSPVPPRPMFPSHQLYLHTWPNIKEAALDVAAKMAESSFLSLFSITLLCYTCIYIYNAPQLWMAELIKGVHTYCIMCSCTVSTVHSVLFMNWTKATAHISPTACLHFIESILKVHLDTQLRKETTDNSWNSRCRGAVLLCIWKRQHHVCISEEVSMSTEPLTSHLFYHFMNDWQSFSSGKSFAG